MQRQRRRHQLGKGIADDHELRAGTRNGCHGDEGDGFGDVILRSCAIASAEITLPGPEACLLLNEYGSHGLLARPD